MNAVEAFEDMLLILLGNARAVISHLNGHHRIFHPATDFDLGILVRGRTIAEGIGEEVENDLLDPPGIGFNGGEIGRKINSNAGMGLADFAFELVDNALCDFRENDFLEVEGEILAFQAGDGEEIFDEEAETQAVAMHDFQSPGGHGWVTVWIFPEGLHVALNDRQRGAEFVGDIGNEFTACGLEIFEFGDFVEDDDCAAGGAVFARVEG